MMPLPSVRPSTGTDGYLFFSHSRCSRERTADPNRTDAMRRTSKTPGKTLNLEALPAVSSSSAGPPEARDERARHLPWNDTPRDYVAPEDADEPDELPLLD